MINTPQRTAALAVVIALSLVAMACTSGGPTSPPGSPSPPSASPTPILIGYTDTESLLEMMRTSVLRDAIPAILDPQFLPADEVPALFRQDEEVIGVAINGEAKAYPIDILSWHEAVNDVVGGVPIVVTW